MGLLSNITRGSYFAAFPPLLTDKVSLTLLTTVHGYFYIKSIFIAMKPQGLDEVFFFPAPNQTA